MLKKGTMRTAPLALPSSFLFVLTGMIPSRADDLLNGYFAKDFSHWATGGDVQLFDDANGDSFAGFGENFSPEEPPPALSSVSQVVTLGPLGTVLTFDYAIVRQGAFAGGALRDAFTARLLDPATGAPLLASPGRNDVFYHQVPNDPAANPSDPGVVLFDAGLVSRAAITDNPAREGWFRVTVNIGSLRGQSVKVEFGLLRAANGQLTVAGLDNVAAAGPPDCNGNGVLDDQDIANGARPDCQPNGIPDECDIADGTSRDADGNGIPDECEGNQPPDCTPAAGPGIVLWPPNHHMRPINVLAASGAFDPDGDPVTIVIDSITQDEPVNDLGDGNTCPDASGAGTGIAEVRAERAGHGNGRVYRINFTAGDPAGAACQGSLKVSVPHDQAHPAVDDRQLYDSTAACGGPAFQSEEDDCAGQSRPRRLTMAYTGQDCTASDHAQSAGSVTCSGDPAAAMLVRVVASDRADWRHPGAKTWFDGPVVLGDTFDVDSRRASQPQLKDKTWIHVLNSDGAALQTVMFTTSCQQPLRRGDSFGGLMLEGFSAK